MKNISQLTNFYYKTLYPDLQELEKERKSLRLRIILVAAFLVLIVFVFILTAQEVIANHAQLLLFIGAICVSVISYTYSFFTKDYTQKFKDKIIAPLINRIDPNLKYMKDFHVPYAHFTRSKIFTDTPDLFEGNDYVTGQIDGINIEFSDILAKKEYINSNDDKKYETMFKGLFIVSEFNKKLKGTTVVLPDTAQNTFGDLLGGWLQSKNLDRNELVKMDNTAFEKEFVVYSTDQIEARYILSHSLMEKLLKFQKGLKHPISISFVGGSIYIAVQSNEDQFEPSIFHSLLQHKVAMEYVSTLHFVIGIVEELKLNQKLWSKS
jgi:hypothetical protein